MDAEIRVIDDDGNGLAANDLAEWLKHEEKLRGRVRIVRGPTGDPHLSSLPELLTVALGAGGAGTVLASSITTWLLTRRSHAKVEVNAKEHKVVLELKTVEQLAPLLRQILEPSDGDD
jgi:hypothetical protein